MIPPRSELPKSWKGLQRLSFDFPYLAPNDPSRCPASMSRILEYLGAEAPGGRESGSSRVIEFALRFIRTALIDGTAFWMWGFKDEGGLDCYVTVRVTPDRECVTGYDEAFGLTPEQWLVMDYYCEEEWENDE
jgi:hypothetical protein